MDENNFKGKHEFEIRLESDENDIVIVDFLTDMFNEMSIFLKKLIVRQYAMSSLE